MSSFGEEIRRERELRTITLREISEATKISMRYLTALEGNDFAKLPGGVFNKGFVRAYSQYIGVDPDAMVNAYLLEQRNQEARARQRDPVRRSDPAESQVAMPRPRKAALVVFALALLILLAAAVAGIVWFRGRQRSDAKPADAVATVAVAHDPAGSPPS